MAMLYYAFGTNESIRAGILSPLPNRCIRGINRMSSCNSSQRFLLPLFFFPIFAAFLVPPALAQAASPMQPAGMEQSTSSETS
jgi:hypothetical protein